MLKQTNKNIKNHSFPILGKNLSLIVVAVVFLAFVQLVIAHNLASLGGKVRLAETTAQIKERQNKLLREEIGEMGSLSRISSLAQEMGFVRTTQVLHLTSQVPFALK